MSVILGLTTYHAGSSAAIIIDGEPVVAIAEERLNRVKYYAGFPKLAVRQCLESANLSFSDIDAVVEIARQAVEAYATKTPSTFQCSTDFITKSLIFVDGEFRARHGISPETRAAAEKANITRV